MSSQNEKSGGRAITPRRRASFPMKMLGRSGVGVGSVPESARPNSFSFPRSRLQTEFEFELATVKCLPDFTQDTEIVLQQLALKVRPQDIGHFQCTISQVLILAGQLTDTRFEGGKLTANLGDQPR